MKKITKLLIVTGTAIAAITAVMVCKAAKKKREDTWFADCCLNEDDDIPFCVKNDVERQHKSSEKPQTNTEHCCECPNNDKNAANANE